MLGQGRRAAPDGEAGPARAWGDRAAAEPILRAMALGRFDYYLPKPAVAPDEGFHSIVEGLLAEWATATAGGSRPS